LHKAPSAGKLGTREQLRQNGVGLLCNRSFPRELIYNLDVADEVVYNTMKIKSSITSFFSEVTWKLHFPVTWHNCMSYSTRKTFLYIDRHNWSTFFYELSFPLCLKAPFPCLRISISICNAYPDIKKWNKINNVGAILVIRISIRINLNRKGVRIDWLSEPIYRNADDILTAFSKIRR